MKIRSKLLISAAISIFCLIAIGAIGSFYTDNVAGVSHSLVEEQAEPIFEIHELEKIVWEMWLRLVVHTSSTDMETMQKLEQEFVQLEKQLANQMQIIEKLHDSHDHQKNSEEALKASHNLQLHEFQQHWANFWKNAQQVLEFSKNFMKEDASTLIVGDGRMTFNEVISSLQKMAKKHHDSMDISSNFALKTRGQAIFTIVILTSIFVGLVAIFIYFINRDILRDVGGEPSSIANITEKVASGDLNVEFDTNRKFTGIYASIKLMVENLKKIQAERESQNWLKTGQMELAEIMSGEQNIDTLAKKVIAFLTTYVNAQIGLFYLTLESRTDSGKMFLKRIADYAYTGNDNIPMQIEMGDGLVGQVALEKKTLLRTYKPSEYERVIQSGLTNAVPRYILLIPFLYEGNVKGVMEIGASKEITEVQQEFLEQVMPSIGIAVNTAESREKMQILLMQMQEQSEEMRQQQEELRQTNEQLESRASELEEKKERWKVH